MKVNNGYHIALTTNAIYKHSPGFRGSSESEFWRRKEKEFQKTHEKKMLLWFLKEHTHLSDLGTKSQFFDAIQEKCRDCGENLLKYGEFERAVQLALKEGLIEEVES
jgi:hypothetical protein